MCLDLFLLPLLSPVQMFVLLDLKIVSNRIKILVITANGALSFVHKTCFSKQPQMYKARDVLVVRLFSTAIAVRTQPVTKVSKSTVKCLPGVQYS